MRAKDFINEEYSWVIQHKDSKRVIGTFKDQDAAQSQFDTISPAKRNQYVLKSVPRKHGIQEDIEIPSGTALAKFISANAKPWLSVSNNGHWVVYRGMRGQNDTVFTRPIRTDRKSMDTLEVRHQAFNAVIKSVGGIANRSNSAFVTSDANFAAGYGEPYVFIPLGDFHYTWSPVYRDWTRDFTGNDLIKLMRPDAPFDEEKILILFSILGFGGVYFMSKVNLKEEIFGE
jgi:hypothetical protein